MRKGSASVEMHFGDINRAGIAGCAEQNGPLPP
jgi:hypothetical protein